MGTSESRVIRFGVYTLDVASGELRKGGTKIRLQEQPFQVLNALVERPGEVVTREELQERLWPDGTYVDYEDGLATAVRKVRTALGDSATNPRFVETLPRRGYRFIAPVDAGAAEPTEPTASSRQERLEETPPKKTPRYYGAALSAVVLVAVVGYFLLGFQRDLSSNLPDLSQYAETPLTNYRGIEGGPSLSPDGKQVAFAWTGESGDNADIYVKLIDSRTEAPFRLTQDPAVDSSPAWSPDGRWIAFIRQDSPNTENFGARVMVKSALGGPPRVVGEDLAVVGNRPGRTLLRSKIAWSPDGRYLAFPAIRATHDDSGPSLAIAPLDGGETRWLSVPDAGYGVTSPAFSPDGRRLAFVRRQGWASGHDVYVSELEPDMTPHGDPLRLTEFARSAGNPVWTGDGQSLLFWGENGNNQSGLWAVSAFGRSAPRLMRPNARLDSLSEMNALSIAADDSNPVQLLAFSVITEDEDIWEVDIEGSLAGRPRPIVNTNAIEGAAFVSPDGSRLAFVSDRSGSRELWIADRDGSRAAQITSLGAPRTGSGEWSPDGESIVFHSFANGQADIDLADPDTGEYTQLTSEPYDQQQPSWSRDGEWIYFRSHGADGKIIKITPDGSKTEVVAEIAGAFPHESWDASKLIYNAPGGGTGSGAVMALPLVNGEPAGEAQELPIARRTLCTVAPGGLYYVDEDGLSFFDFERWESRHVFPLEEGMQVWSVTADGKTLMLNRKTNDSDLKLLRAPHSTD